MDPDRTVELIVLAMQTGDYTEGMEHIENLVTWLDKGGFIPTNVDYMNKAVVMDALACPRPFLYAVAKLNNTIDRS